MCIKLTKDSSAKVISHPTDRTKERWLFWKFENGNLEISLLPMNGEEKSEIGNLERCGFGNFSKKMEILFNFSPIPFY